MAGRRSFFHKLLQRKSERQQHLELSNRADAGTRANPISLARGPGSDKYGIHEGDTVPVKITEPNGTKTWVFGQFVDYGPDVQNFDFAATGKFASWKSGIPDGASIVANLGGGRTLRGSVYNPGGGNYAKGKGEGGYQGAGNFGSKILTAFAGKTAQTPRSDWNQP